MSRNRISIRSLILVSALLILIIVSISPGMQPDKSKVIEQSSLCLNCHDDQTESLKGSPHQLTSEKDLSSAIAVGCTSCHDGWEKHQEDPSAENIEVASKLAPAKQAEICSRCHLTGHQEAMVTTDPHGRAGLGCSSCHQIHSNPNSKLTKDKSQNFCLTCHTDVAAKFKSRSAHPLRSGNIKCTDCHLLSDIKDHDLAVGIDWNCQGCHSEISGPYIYEHPVTSEFRVEGSGCTECHQPHGSANDRLLRQPGSGVCLQCHAMPPGHRLNHGGLGARHACVDCHSEIHGSNNNRKFLDPELGQKLVVNCYQSGCHNLDD